jgi:hypothetical protein
MTCFQYHSQPPRHPGRLCSCSAVLPTELYPGQTSQNPPGAGALLVTGKRKNGWNEPVAPIVLSGWTKPKLVSGFNPTPLKNMKVSWDYCLTFPYIWKKIIFQSTNQILIVSGLTTSSRRNLPDIDSPPWDRGTRPCAPPDRIWWIKGSKGHEIGHYRGVRLHIGSELSLCL